MGHAHRATRHRIVAAGAAALAGCTLAGTATGAPADAVHAARAARSGPPDVIRTGGPSAPADAKVAIVAARRPLTNKPFKVVSASGKVVLAGRLKKATGPVAPWRYAASADLSKVTRPGRYRVRAAGLLSRAWVVDPNARPQLVRRLLKPFALNSDGNEPNPVFGPAHLNDALVKGGPYDGQRVDLVGGWRDAGDQLKITQPAAFAVALLELSARLDPGDAPAIHQTADVGVRWLLKAHPHPDLFIGLVGDDRDHSTGFRDPAQDDANTVDGVGIRHAYPTTSANVLGETAAALALAAQRTPAGDPQHDALVAAAQEWYAAGKASSAIVPIADPNVSDYYPDVLWAEDLAFAALELWRATGDPALLTEATNYLSRDSDDKYYSGVTTGSIAPIVAADLCGGLGAPAPDDAAARAVGCDGVAKTVSAARDRMNGDALDAFDTPGIVTFGWSQDNSGAGAIAAAAQRAGVARDGLRIAANASDYLLGRNPWGRSFVVGTGPIDAKNPHHGAYLKGNPAQLADGAVVEGEAKPSDLKDQGITLGPGPLRRFDSSKVVWEDRRDDYVTGEIGIVTSATAVLLQAGLRP